MSNKSNVKDIQNLKALFRYFISFMKLENSSIPDTVIMDLIILMENLLYSINGYDLVNNDAFNELESDGWIECGMFGEVRQPWMIFGKELRESALVTRELIKHDFDVDAYFDSSFGINMIYIKDNGKDHEYKILTAILLTYLYYKYIEENREEAERTIESIERVLRGESENECTENNSTVDISSDSVCNILR